MSHGSNRRIVLAARPQGRPKPSDFRLEEVPAPAPQEDEVLLEVIYLSLDPYMRGRMDARKSYAKPVEIGEAMEGGGVARVVASRFTGLAAGDVVLARTGWQSLLTTRGESVRKLEPAGLPLSLFLGVLGMPGFTAYAGLLNIGKPQPGETVVVSSAAGAVGSAVGQIARIKGARAVGIAGGAAKCAFVRDELGFDACVDYKAADFADQLRAACPDGVDVYFENVGGAVWDAVFPLLNTHARVPVCGLIAQYNATGAEGRDRLPGVMRDVLTRSLTVRGFIQTEFVSQLPDFQRDMGGWVRDGNVRWKEDRVQGLAQAPEALIGLLEGANFGKLVVQVAPE